MTPPKPTILLLSLILITHHIHSTSAYYYISITQLRNTLSLSHTFLSLSHTHLHRVAYLRFSRGDTAGAHRAQLLASKLKHVMGMRFWYTVFSLCWDYYRNYAWRHPVSFKDTGDFHELMTRSLTELAQVKSGTEWAAWVERNYGEVRRIFQALFARLLSVLNESGPLKELVETLKTEMEEGDFLVDCLEVGTKDLRGLFQILNDISSQYSTADHKQELEL